MRRVGTSWNKGGPPGAIDADVAALAQADSFFGNAA